MFGAECAFQGATIGDVEVERVIDQIGESIVRHESGIESVVVAVGLAATLPLRTRSLNDLGQGAEEWG